MTGGLAIVASTNEVAAFDLRSGAPAWRVTAAELGGELAEDAILLAGDDVVFLAGADRIARVRGDDGTPVAITPVAGTPTSAVATSAGVAVAVGDEVIRFVDDGEGTRARLPGPATGPLVAHGPDVLTTTPAGAVRVAADGTVTTGPDLPATAVSTSDDFTIVAFDVGEGFLAFYGPAPAAG